MAHTESTAQRPPHLYDRRGMSRDELPPPTHDFMFLSERKPVTVPGWLIPFITMLFAAGVSIGAARFELNDKASKGDVTAVNAKLERVLDILCDRDPQSRPRACAGP